MLRFRLIELYSFVILAYQQQPFIQAYIRFVALILMFLVQLSYSLILNSTPKILATADGIKNTLLSCKLNILHFFIIRVKCKMTAANFCSTLMTRFLPNLKTRAPQRLKWKNLLALILLFPRTVRAAKKWFRGISPKVNQDQSESPWHGQVQLRLIAMTKTEKALVQKKEESCWEREREREIERKS